MPFFLVTRSIIYGLCVSLAFRDRRIFRYFWVYLLTFYLWWRMYDLGSSNSPVGSGSQHSVGNVDVLDRALDGFRREDNNITNNFATTTFG